MTYAILSVAVLAVLALLTVPTLKRLPRRPLLLTAAALVALTAVFDNVIVAVGLVDYDPARILGVHVPSAPIEDFAYALGSVMLIPALWTWLGRDRKFPRGGQGGEP